MSKDAPGGLEAIGEPARPRPTPRATRSDAARREGRDRHRRGARPRPRVRARRWPRRAPRWWSTTSTRRVREVAAWPRSCPVGSTEAADALVERAVAEFGRLDVMVTNAGVLRDKVLWKMSDDDFDTVVDTHLRGTFTCARAAAIRMRAQEEGGRIIVVGSPAGQYGNFGQTNYAAAKAGIVAFARTWAMELARAQITVNAIVPTAWTRMTASIPIYAPLVGPRRVPAGGAARARARRPGGLRAAGRLPGLRRGGGRDRAGDRDRRRPAVAVLAPGRGGVRAARRRLDARTRSPRPGRPSTRSRSACGCRSWTCRERRRAGGDRRPHARRAQRRGRAGPGHRPRSWRRRPRTSAARRRSRPRRRSPTTTASAGWRR